MADKLTQKELESLLTEIDVPDALFRKTLKVDEDLEYTIMDEVDNIIDLNNIDINKIITINEYKRNNYYEIVIYYKG